MATTLQRYCASHSAQCFGSGLEVGALLSHSPVLRLSLTGLEVGALTSHSSFTSVVTEGRPVTCVEFAMLVLVWRTTSNRSEPSPPNFTMSNNDQSEHHLERMDVAEHLRSGLSATPSFDISLDMGDSTSPVSRAGSQASMSSLRPTGSSLCDGDDMALVLLELGLTAEERKELEARTSAERPSISRVKTEEWMDTDDFLWSPSGC
jgi:hypothetical protein